MCLNSTFRCIVVLVHISNSCIFLDLFRKFKFLNTHKFFLMKSMFQISNLMSKKSLEFCQYKLVKMKTMFWLNFEVLGLHQTIFKCIKMYTKMLSKGKKIVYSFYSLMLSKDLHNYPYYQDTHLYAIDFSIRFLILSLFSLETCELDRLL